MQKHCERNASTGNPVPVVEGKKKRKATATETQLFLNFLLVRS